MSGTFGGAPGATGGASRAALPVGHPHGTVVRRRQEGADDAIAGIRQVLAAYPDADIEITWRVVR